MTVYVHHVRGRLRIQSAAFKNNPQQVHALLARLQHQDGIDRVDFRARTGSIVIAYDVNTLQLSKLLSIFETQGVIIPYRQGSPDKAASAHASSLLHTTISVAWTRLVQELVGALLATVILPKIPRATAALQGKKAKTVPKTVRKK
jgi:hypothetical protein